MKEHDTKKFNLTEYVLISHELNETIMEFARRVYYRDVNVRFRYYHNIGWTPLLNGRDIMMHEYFTNKYRILLDTCCLLHMHQNRETVNVIDRNI